MISVPFRCRRLRVYEVGMLAKSDPRPLAVALTNWQGRALMARERRAVVQADGG